MGTKFIIHEHEFVHVTSAIFNITKILLSHTYADSVMIDVLKEASLISFHTLSQLKDQNLTRTTCFQAAVKIF